MVAITALAAFLTINWKGYAAKYTDILPLLNWNSVELSLVWAVLPITHGQSTRVNGARVLYWLYNLSSDNDPVPQTLFDEILIV
jgi:hypothetical protein